MIAPGRAKRPTTARRPRAGTPPTAAPANEAPAPPHAVARLVPLDPGLYAFNLAAKTHWRHPVEGLVLPRVHVCAAPHEEGAIEITDGFGRAGSWLGERDKVLFVTSHSGGGTALVTGYLTGEPDSLPLELEIRSIAVPGSATPAAVMTLTLGDLAQAEAEPQSLRLEIVAHIRNRGDVSFLDTPSVGRLGPGLWIEGFSIVLHGRLAEAAIEYKGLSASGTETPWIESGTLCGSRGMGIPLVGFAVRQKAGAGEAPLECEYTGYFQSGAMAGPARNGAPCRSTIENDPLEGIELRIAPRPARRDGGASP